jgi:hypothetical protein
MGVGMIRLEFVFIAILFFSLIVTSGLLMIIEVSVVIKKRKSPNNPKEPLPMVSISRATSLGALASKTIRTIPDEAVDNTPTRFTHIPTPPHASTKGPLMTPLEDRTVDRPKKVTATITAANKIKPAAITKGRQPKTVSETNTLESSNQPSSTTKALPKLSQTPKKRPVGRPKKTTTAPTTKKNTSKPAAKPKTIAPKSTPPKKSIAPLKTKKPLAPSAKSAAKTAETSQKRPVGRPKKIVTPPVTPPKKVTPAPAVAANAKKTKSTPTTITPPKPKKSPASSPKARVKSTGAAQKRPVGRPKKSANP